MNPLKKSPLIELGRRESRRNFLKYTVAAGALLGLDRWKVFEVGESLGGQAFAADMACAPTNRSVHIIAGTGGFAWFNLLWPHVDIALAKNDAFAFHAPDQAMTAQGSDRPLVLGPEAPWRGQGAKHHVSAFMAGVNQTHTRAPNSSSQVGPNLGLFATCAALQTASPTLVPVISVSSNNQSMPYMNAPGAPSVVQVGSPDGMVDLFNAAASSAMGALSNPRDASLFEAYYKGFLALSRAAGKPTTNRGLATTKTAANLIGVNLSNQLRPTGEDLARYGVMGAPARLADLAKGLITTAKAFKLGLTSCVLLPAFNDDPHQAFADLNGLRATTTAMGKMLDGFLNDLRQIDDPTCAGTKLADNVVLSVHGDTPKNPLVRAAWPDGTPGNSTWC